MGAGSPAGRVGREESFQAPFLALGAELGLRFALLSAVVFPDVALPPQGVAVVGMAALFAAIVRAPLTAIVLVVEITANATMLMPMIVSCFVAMLVQSLLSDESILDSLKARLLGSLAETLRTRCSAP